VVVAVGAHQIGQQFGIAGLLHPAATIRGSTTILPRT
jgi:hypothetical protein